MATFTSPTAVYVGLVLYPPGEPFTTDGPVGANWAKQPAPEAEPEAEPAERPRGKLRASH